MELLEGGLSNNKACFRKSAIIDVNLKAVNHGDIKLRVTALTRVNRSIVDFYQFRKKLNLIPKILSFFLPEAVRSVFLSDKEGECFKKQ